MANQEQKVVRLKYPYQARCFQCGWSKAQSSMKLAQNWSNDHARKTGHKKVAVYDR